MLTGRRIAPLTAADVDSVHALSRAVGWPHRRADIEIALDLGRPWGAFDEVGGRLIGTASWWPMGERAARVGLVIVDPAAQGRGVGRALMDRVMADVERRAVALLATEPGRPLYESLGFERVGSSQRHVGDCRVEPTIDGAVGRLERSHTDEVIRLDARALGAPRPAIVEHLVSVGDGVVLRADDAIVGYAVRRPFGTGHVIGPIVAGTEDAATSLLLALAEPGMIRVDRPTHADHLGTVLDRIGLRAEETSPIMTRGTWPGARSAVSTYAMASHAWG
ncbi:MAG: GNAT family N-acetyltransferase [Actinomycetota bacterium]